MGAPFVYTSKSPDNKVRVAKVTINGGKEPFVINKPLKNPHAVPTISAVRIADTMPKNALPDHDVTALSAPAQSAPERPRIEPTERSIPPVKMTNVIPHAKIEIIETCLITLKILVRDKKSREIMEAKIKIIASIAKLRYSFMILLKIRFLLF